MTTELGKREIWDIDSTERKVQDPIITESQVKAFADECALAIFRKYDPETPLKASPYVGQQRRCSMILVEGQADNMQAAMSEVAKAVAEEWNKDRWANFQRVPYDDEVGAAYSTCGPVQVCVTCRDIAGSNSRLLQVEYLCQMHPPTR